MLYFMGAGLFFMYFGIPKFIFIFVPYKCTFNQQETNKSKILLSLDPVLYAPELSAYFKIKFIMCHLPVKDQSHHI